MQAKSYMMMMLMVLVPPFRRHSQRCTFRSMHCCTGKMCTKCVCVFARTCILSHRNTTQHDTAEKQDTVNAKQLEAYFSTPHFFCNNLFIMHRADKMKWQRTMKECTTVTFGCRTTHIVAHCKCVMFSFEKKKMGKTHTSMRCLVCMCVCYFEK